MVCLIPELEISASLKSHTDGVNNSVLCYQLYHLLLCLWSLNYIPIHRHSFAIKWLTTKVPNTRC